MGLSTVTVAYCLLVHKNPAQVKRLLERIRDPGDLYYVNVFNAQTPRAVDAWRSMFQSLPDLRLHTQYKYRSGWGKIHLVAATLDAMKHFIEQEYDYLVNLSGQCYPIKPVSQMKTRLSPKTHTWMRFKEYPGSEPAKAMRRFTHWSVVLPVTDRGLSIALPRVRSGLPHALKPFGGSQWFFMKREHVEYVLDFVSHHPDLLEFFRRASVPDETFFQTILLNSQFRDFIKNEKVRYVEWSKELDAPKILTREDLPRILKSDRVWARKFDIEVDSRILDELDRLATHPDLR